jgi:hypothetical protein
VRRPPASSSAVRRFLRAALAFPLGGAPLALGAQKAPRPPQPAGPASRASSSTRWTSPGRRRSASCCRGGRPASSPRPRAACRARGCASRCAAAVPRPSPSTSRSWWWTACAWRAASARRCSTARSTSRATTTCRWTSWRRSTCCPAPRPRPVSGPARRPGPSSSPPRRARAGRPERRAYAEGGAAGGAGEGPAFYRGVAGEYAAGIAYRGGCTIDVQAARGCTFTRAEAVRPYADASRAGARARLGARLAGGGERARYTLGAYGTRMGGPVDGSALAQGLVRASADVRPAAALRVSAGTTLLTRSTDAAARSAGGPRPARRERRPPIRLPVRHPRRRGAHDHARGRRRGRPPGPRPAGWTLAPPSARASPASASAPCARCPRAAPAATWRRSRRARGATATA